MITTDSRERGETGRWAERPRHRSTRLARLVLVGVCAAVFGAQAAMPHIHSFATHANEICSGHLNAHGAPDLEYGQSCLQCRSAKRGRLVEQPISESADVATSEGLRFSCLETPVLPSLLARSSAAPRAPPHTAAS